MLLAFSCRKLIHTHIHTQTTMQRPSTGIRQATWQGRFQECSPGEGKCPSPSQYRAVNLTGLYTLMMRIFYDIFYVNNTILFIIIPTPVRCEDLHSHFHATRVPHVLTNLQLCCQWTFCYATFGV